MCSSDLLCHSFLAYKISAEKSADTHMGAPLYVTRGFTLYVCNILSLSVIFDTLIIMSWSGSFGIYLLLYFLNLDICLLCLVKEVFCHYFKYVFCPFPPLSPPGIHKMQMLVCLTFSQKSLKLSFFKKMFAVPTG